MCFEHSHLLLSDGKVGSIIVLVATVECVPLWIIPLRELVLSKSEAAQAVPAEILLLVNDGLALLVRHSLDVAVEENVRAPVEDALRSTLHENGSRTVFNFMNVNLILVLGVERDDKDGRVRLADLLDIPLLRDVVSL